MSARLEDISKVHCGDELHLKLRKGCKMQFLIILQGKKQKKYFLRKINEKNILNEDFRVIKI